MRINTFIKYLFPLFVYYLLFSCQSKQSNDENNPDPIENEIDSINAPNKKVNPAVYPSKAYIKDGNVFVAYNDEQEKKLTFTGQDAHPFLLEESNQVLFVRSFKMADYSYKYIMLVNTENLKESVLADKKPYKDGQHDSEMIFLINSPMLSEDQRYLYFISEKYATGTALMRVNLETKKWVEISHANSFSVVEKGIMKGNFAIGASEVRGEGRQQYWFIVDRNGNKMKDFGNSKAELDHFLGTGNQKMKNASGSKLSIKKLVLHSIPSRKPSGKNWDNMAGGYHPDLYLQVYGDNGKLLFGSRDRRTENVIKSDLPITYEFEYTLKNATEILTFVFKDFDSISGDDQVAAASFNATGYSKSDKSDRHKKGDFEVEIVWEWGE